MSSSSDTEAIARVKAEYLYAIDTKDWALLRRVLADDAVMDASAQFPDDPQPAIHVVHGADWIVQSIRGYLGQTASAHLAASPIITVAGDAARGIWAMTDTLFLPDGRRMIGYGHYDDEFHRIEGSWRIARFVILRTKILHLPAG